MKKGRETKKILLVDDELSHRVMLRANIEAEGFTVFEASDGLEAVKMMDEGNYQCVLMDIRMPRMDGITAMREIKKKNSAVPIIIMTAYGSVSTAIESLKSGAEDYVMKPVNIDELLIKVEKIVKFHHIAEENLVFKERLNELFDFSTIIGSSGAIREMYDLLKMVAPTDATVLILGESGTGKELVANSIHQNSRRKERPFMKVNCAALPENLLESELFGHEKGAFTGAVSRKDGRFKAADGGSIFLDEIGEMNNATQAKILRVLQEKEFEPLGSNRTVSVDVRVISATNSDLEEEVERGGFREDLFYRLNVVPVNVPPLRERREDIQELAVHFLSKYKEKNQKKIDGFQEEALSLLMKYRWPGNVRELENVVERGVIMCRGKMITPSDLPEKIRDLDPASRESEGISPGMSLREAERILIVGTLKQTGGNRTRSAEILGITRKTLHNKIKEYEIEV